MNKTFSIKAQLFSLLGLLLLLMALSLGVALRYLETQNDKNQYVTDVVAQRTIVAQQWIVSLLESARHMRNTLILEDTDKIKNELDSLNLEILERKKRLDELKKLSTDSASFALFTAISDSRDIYLPKELEFIRLIQAGNFKEARAQLLNSSRPAQLDYVDKLYKYINPALNELKSAEILAKAEMETARSQVVVLGLLAMVFGAITGWWVLRSLLRQLGGEPQYAVELANRIAMGDQAVQVNLKPGDQSSLLYAIKAMAHALTINQQSKERNDWVKTGLVELSVVTRRELPPVELAYEVLTYTINRLQGVVGAMYFYHANTRVLERVASQGLLDEDLDHREANIAFELGQGLVGLAAQHQRLQLVNSLPSGYLRTRSGTGSGTPEALVLVPLIDASGLVGLLEIGSFQPFDEVMLEFIESAKEGIGVGLGSALARQRTHELLATTQAQSEELQSQQEELEQNNEELREHAQALDAQRRELDSRNVALRNSTAEIEWRAQELERVSRYKSEFLANMSHELRTPLNSMLMLSALLHDNREQTLTEKQSQFAAAIHAAGQDLLTLINDILDLSKIEAGQVDYLIEEHGLDALLQPLEQMFAPLAQQKSLQLNFVVNEDAPKLLRIDLRRTQQILKNLLSNAIKFTDTGYVDLKISMLDAAMSPLRVPSMVFAVSDSGIGIAEDKQSLVFEAFKQADGGINRSYGGTGLGLSISRQLAIGLEGQLNLVSKPGHGSTFSLLLPLQLAVHIDDSKMAFAVDSLSASSIAADVVSDKIQRQQGRQILIVEDDANFRSVLLERCQQHHLSALTAADGQAALALAEQYLPAAILLDVMLPKLNGWDLMRHLQSQPQTAKIPVHFITALDERAHAFELGASSFATKPISIAQLDALLEQVAQQIAMTPWRILIVEDDAVQAYALSELLNSPTIQVDIAPSAQQALHLLEQGHFDALILDLGLSDMKGEDLLQLIRQQYSIQQLPILVHSGQYQSSAQERQLRHLAQVVIVKGEYSPIRVRLELQTLLDAKSVREENLLTTSVIKDDAVPDPANVHASSNLLNLKGRTILLADDDIRNVFAIGSLLSYYGVVLIEAENGREALELLEKNPQIELVLMDIMMPEMDGYTAMRAIRSTIDRPNLSRLPIIAMTAKTMPGDRELCLEAGANDYIAKPIDNEILLSMLQVWLVNAKHRDAHA
jgi:CheY-like chemotaxis protein